MCSCDFTVEPLGHKKSFKWGTNTCDCLCWVMWFPSNALSSHVVFDYSSVFEVDCVRYAISTKRRGSWGLRGAGKMQQIKMFPSDLQCFSCAFVVGLYPICRLSNVTDS